MAPKECHPGRRPAAIGSLRRNDPFVRRSALAWRRLTGGGGRTMVACSGGADSTALLLALTLTTPDLVVAHVRHDLRPRDWADADRDAVRNLAEQLNLPFVEAEVRVADRHGNKEALARRERYATLARLARQSACPFVATAHHADDQLETMLMALLRGAGPHGLRGIAPSLPLPLGEGGESSSRVRGFPLPLGEGGESSSRVRGFPLPPGGSRGEGHRHAPVTLSPHHPITLVRPMLQCTRAEARAACTAAGVAWREDATNLDTTRRRAALRHNVLPLLAELAPAGARHAARSADLLRDAVALIDERVKQVFGDGLAWNRAVLRRESPLILGLGLRRAALRLTRGRHADQLTSRVVSSAVRAVLDGSAEPREFRWPGGVVLRVAARAVSLQ